MYQALMYEYADDYLERRTPFREEHLALLRAAHGRGEVVMAGAFTDDPGGALLVWSTEDPDVVEDFVKKDPYVAGGVVTSWRIRPWNVVVGGTGAS